MYRWIKLAYKESIKGRHKQHFVGVVVVSGGRVLAKSFNLSRPYGIENRGFHAEERALRNLRVEGTTVIVVRTNRSGNICGQSKPCSRCLAVLRERKVKKICYLDDNKTVVIEKLLYN